VLQRFCMESRLNCSCPSLIRLTAIPNDPVTRKWQLYQTILWQLNNSYTKRSCDKEMTVIPNDPVTRKWQLYQMIMWQGNNSYTKRSCDKEMTAIPNNPVTRNEQAHSYTKWPCDKELTGSQLCLFGIILFSVMLVCMSEWINIMLCMNVLLNICIFVYY